MSKDRRAELELKIKEAIAIIDNCYRARIERAISNQWHGELRRILAYRQRDIDRALAPFVSEYARLAIPPFVIDLETGKIRQTG